MRGTADTSVRAPIGPNGLPGHTTPATASALDAPPRVLVLGGTSEIAGAIVRELARRGGADDVVLAGRDMAGLAAAAQALRQAGCGQVREVALSDTHEQVLSEAIEMLGTIDVVVLAVGELGERGGLPEDLGIAVRVLETNVVYAGSLLLHTARTLRAQGSGTLVVLSSVAAERPRASNAVYCASKAGLDTLARGIDDALRGSGARVMVVRPGFVRTRMTHRLPVPPLACDPETVAQATAQGLRHGVAVVWAPRTLRWIMAALGVLPSPLWRRLPL